jgi:hypothetical protein
VAKQNCAATALPDQRLHSAEAVQPQRRKSAFAPEVTLLSARLIRRTPPGNP